MSSLKHSLSAVTAMLLVTMALLPAGTHAANMKTINAEQATGAEGSDLVAEGDSGRQLLDSNGFDFGEEPFSHPDCHKERGYYWEWISDDREEDHWGYKDRNDRRNHFDKPRNCRPERGYYWKWHEADRREDGYWGYYKKHGDAPDCGDRRGYYWTWYSTGDDSPGYWGYHDSDHEDDRFKHPDCPRKRDYFWKWHPAEGRDDGYWAWLFRGHD